MEDVLQYAGKRVVVTGAASGMGAAAARILVDLGAEVIGLDVKPTEVPVAKFIQVDLKDPASVAAAVAGIGGPVDSVFSVAGLPGPPFSDLDTILVNFVGARNLVESLVPLMPEGSSVVCVASNAGMGWEQALETLLPVVQTDGFDAGKAYLEEHADLYPGNGYAFSKQLVNAWVAWRAPSLLTSLGIRLNNTNPGPTQTAMMPQFEAATGAALIDAFVGPSNRRSVPEEQAWPMIFLNSPRSSYVAGTAFPVDGAFAGAMMTGQIDLSILDDLMGTGSGEG